MRRALREVCLAGVLTACAGSTSPETGMAPVAEAGEDGVAWVGEAVVLDGSASVGERLRWDTGDGTRIEGAVVSHVYDTPGRYAAVIEVTGADGARITDSRSVLITHPPASPAPRRGGPLSIAPDGSIWVALPEAGAVARVRDQEIVRVPTCVGVSAISAGPDVILVTCPEHDRVDILDATTLERQARSVEFAPGSRPINLVSLPNDPPTSDGPWVVALAGTGQLAWVGLGGRVAITVDIGGDPTGLVALPSGDIVASRLRGVSDVSRLVRVEAGAGRVLPLDLAYQPGPDTDTNTGGVPHLIAQLAVSPDGGTLYAPGVLANTARGPTRSGQALSFETTVRAHLSVVDLESWTEDTGRRKIFDDQGRALAVSVSPRGDLVWVSHPGTGVVHGVDAFTGALRRSLLAAGRGITGLATVDGGDTLIVYAWLDRELHAYDLRVDPPSRTWSVSLVEREPLGDEILRGKQIFWEAGDPRISRAGYMACAHCHPDGDQDGLVWDFSGRGEGVRNTISLHGRAGLGHGPLHWTANFDEVQDFEHDLRGPNAGHGLLSDADFAATGDPLGAPKSGLSEELDALAAYVSSLDRVPVSPVQAPDGGAEAFARAGCEACHPPPRFTDSGSALHDIGTLTEASGKRLGTPLVGLDTPTLLGVQATPPYLHDGSAMSVRDAILAHDGAERIDRVDLEAIVGFVRSL